MTSRKRDRWDSSSDEEDNNDHDDNGEEQEQQHTKQLSNNSLAKRNRIQHSSAHQRGPSTDHDKNTSDGNYDHEGASAVTNNDTNERITNNSMAKAEATKLTLPKHNPLLSGCRSVYDCYERLARVDEGTYGVVWKAKDLATKEVVALKQIKFDNALRKEGFPIAALREIGVLLALSHESIVTVKEMVVGDSFDQVFMVMEFMEMDLQEATKKSGTSPYPQSELKSMLHQILSAMHHIHDDKWILHRDIKTSNILVQSHSGKIALCDFGLARKYQMPLKAMTQMVVTLWYRPPELLFGETVYGPAVDMWSVGCVFGELMKKQAILQGQGELDQIDKIIQLLGVPNEETNWPGFTALPNAKTFRWKPKNKMPFLSKTFPVNSFSGGQTYLDSNGFDLLRRLLCLNPKDRISAKDALDHAYFHEGVEMQRPQFFG